MQTAHIIEKAEGTQRTFSRLVSIGLLALLPVTASAQQVHWPIDMQPIEGLIVAQPIEPPIVVEPPTFEPHPTTVQKISDIVRIPVPDLRILGGRQVTLPYLGTQLELYKVFDEKTGDSHHVVLDSTGAQVDYEALQQEDRALRYKKYGSMQVALHDLVERGEQGTIPVLIKLNMAEKYIDKEAVSPEDVEEESVVVSRRLKTLGLTQPLQAAEVLRTIFDRIQHQFPEAVAESGPFISTDLSPEAIRALSRDPGVAFIGIHDEKEIPDYPTIVESLPTTRTNTVHSYGTKGAGVKIAVLA